MTLSPSVPLSARRIVSGPLPPAALADVLGKESKCPGPKPAEPGVGWLHVAWVSPGFSWHSPRNSPWHAPAFQAVLSAVGVPLSN